MRDAVRSESLRARSGPAVLAIACFVVLLPALMISAGPPLETLKDLDGLTATRTLFGLIASSVIVAMFLGSYSVTREYYYRSMPRSLTVLSMRDLFTAKVIASALMSVLVCAAGMIVWAAVTAVLLHGMGVTPRFAGAVWAIVGGSLSASVCGSVIGVAVGWIVKNYYVATVVVLLVPVMVELPLLFTAPAVERFLPLGATAAMTRVPVEGMLPVWAGALVLIGWATLASVAASVIVRRREH